MGCSSISGVIGKLTRQKGEIMTDLTTSQIERQNILNNSLALQKAEEILKVPGFYFEDTFYFTNSQLATFFEVDIRTIERLVEAHKTELTENGYHTLRGEKLAKFKENAFATDTNVGSKVTQLSISSFRTLLNFAMLLTNSDIAKQVRNTLLDIVINVLTEKTGGHVKFINQRDKNYLSTALEEDNARKIFTNAIDKYVSGSNFKYGQLTNEIYKAIFKERASEYKKILKLNKNDNARATMYSEVLIVIASFEKGVAYEIEQKSKSSNQKLTNTDVIEIIQRLANHPMQEPHLMHAREKMASRDLSFRNAKHEKLAEYIRPISEEDFERFIGEQSKSLSEQIDEHRQVFERLRDK